ncbi:MAG: HAMP domain-containing sensor histidine kinase [Verrucomicrobiota bacterium]
MLAPAMPATLTFNISVVILIVVMVILIWRLSLKYEIHQRHVAEKELTEAKATAEAAQGRAESANYRKSEFLGIAAHDLKNPLSSIRGMAELIEEDLESLEDLPEERKVRMTAMLGDIQDSANHMLILIRDLLNVEALESGAQQLAQACVILNPLVADVVDFNRPGAKKKGISIEFVERVEKSTFFGDATRAWEILDNLINNAVKYSPRGSTIRVEVGRKDDDSGVQVAIVDQGPGLSPNDLEKLFGRFARGSAKPTGGESSTGLGLSIVKTLVEQMYGKVWAENREESQGSIFYVEFPDPTEKAPEN